MGFLTDIVGGFLGDIVPGIMANESADKQADSIVEATKQANQTQMDMFNRSIALNEPFRQAGLNALGLQGGLLGMSGLVPQDAVTASMASDPNSTVWSQYLQQNPDVASWANTAASQPYFTKGAGKSADYDQNGTISPNEMAQYHYNTYGKSEGRQIGQPGGMQGTGQVGTAQPVGQGYTPDTAYDAFNNSGFAKSMLETTNADFNNMIGAFGAGGNALSGSAIGALNDRNRRNTSGAFNNYYNALSGISNTGANIGSQQGQQAIQTGQNIAAGQQAIGNTRASSYATQGANNMGMYNNALSGMGYGAGNSGGSWFGG
jgi:hypothetical protein